MKNKKVDSWDFTSQKYLARGRSSLSAQSGSTFLGVLREETDDISDFVGHEYQQQRVCGQWHF